MCSLLTGSHALVANFEQVGSSNVARANDSRCGDAESLVVDAVKMALTLNNVNRWTGKMSRSLRSSPWALQTIRRAVWCAPLTCHTLQLLPRNILPRHKVCSGISSSILSGVGAIDLAIIICKCSIPLPSPGIGTGA